MVDFAFNHPLYAAAAIFLLCFAVAALIADHDGGR